MVVIALTALICFEQVADTLVYYKMPICNEISEQNIIKMSFVLNF